jgi:hypothetical protein
VVAVEVHGTEDGDVPDREVARIGAGEGRDDQHDRGDGRRKYESLHRATLRRSPTGVGISGGSRQRRCDRLTQGEVLGGASARHSRGVLPDRPGAWREEPAVSDAPVQSRPRWAQVTLMIVTLGIYWPVWYFLVNRQLRDLGRERADARLAGSRPWYSVAAITLGRLILIPPFVSYVRFAARLQAGERAAGLPHRPADGIVVVLVGAQVASYVLLGLHGPIVYALAGLVFAGLLVAMVLVQSRMNALAGAGGRAAAQAHR